jgi:outer membrane protein assembly factor BamD (BamD/ComL family)
MRLGFILTAALAACFLASCSHIPKSIPDDISAKELVQRAQEATDAYHYDAAIVYYRTLNERFGSDPLYKSTAEYEIAFIAYKQKNYSEAKAGLELLLKEYSSPEGASYPPRYAVLAKKVIEKIDEKLKEKAPKAKEPAVTPAPEQPKEEAK